MPSLRVMQTLSVELSKELVILIAYLLLQKQIEGLSMTDLDIQL
jgi:hypothetical protein